MRRFGRHDHSPRGHGWFSQLPLLSKIGLFSLVAQAAILVVVLLAPQATAAAAGGALVALGNHLLPGEGYLVVGMLKSTLPVALV